MSYQKTTWKNNSAPYVSAENLNKMENGIYSAQADADTAKSTSASNTTAISTLDGRITSLGQSVSNLVVALNGRITAVDAKADENAENIETNKETESNHFSYVYGEITTVKEDIDDLSDSVDDIADDVSVLQTKESATERSLEMLWKLNKGQTYDIEETTESGTSDAPSGAEYCTLEEVYGKSSQHTTNGYQLLNFTDKVVEYNGVTITVSGETVTLNGTATSSNTVPLGTVELQSGTYTFNNFNYSLNNNDTNIRLLNEPYNTIAIFSNCSEQYHCKTFTLEDTVSFNVHVRINNNTTYNNYAIPIMLEKGSTAHSYEPYTGGIPQPNPSYHSEIVDVTEEHFKVEGKNLINAKDITSSGSKIKVNDFVLKAGKTYTVKFFGKKAEGNANLLNSSNQIVLKIPYYSYQKTITPTEDIDVSYVACDIDSSGKYSVVVEYGEHDITEYSKYYEPQSRTMSYTLRGIGDYTDVMDVESGKIVRKIGAERFSNLTNDWKSVTNGCIQKLTSFSGMIKNTPMLSNYFKYNSVHTSISSALSNGEFGDNTSGLITVKSSLFTSVSEFVSFITNNVVILKYALATPTEESISADDLAFLRGLENLSADHTITVTDQNGNDISYLVEWIIKLSEVV